jgi:hypothetical protein
MRMKTQNPEQTLQNEEHSKMPALPSGTFTKDGLPTIVTELIANHVVRLMMIGRDPFEHLSEMVHDLDSHSLLPKKGLTQEIKEQRIKWAVRMMLEEKETIRTKSATIYSACQIAMKRAKSQIKIARAF